MKKQILAIVFSLFLIPVFLLVNLGRTSAAVSTLAYTSFDVGDSTMRVRSIQSDGTVDTQLSSGIDAMEGAWEVIWSPDGTKIAYSVSDVGGIPSNLYVMEADGSNETAITTSGFSGVYGVSWSPDSSKLAFIESDDGGATYNIYSANADGTSKTQLSNGDSDTCPKWASTNSKIIFVSQRDADYELYSMNPDGSGEVNITSTTGADGFFSGTFCSFDISPDGSTIAFSSDRSDPGTTTQLYSMNISGGSVTALTAYGAGSMSITPSWSNNGTQIAFGSNQHNIAGGVSAFQVYSMTSSGDSETQLTSLGANIFMSTQLLGGVDWSPDDSQIAFASTRNGGQIQAFIMSADGSNQTQLVATNMSYRATWQPSSSSPTPTPTPSSGSSSSSSAATLAETGDSFYWLYIVALVLSGAGVIGLTKRLARR